MKLFLEIFSFIAFFAFVWFIAARVGYVCGRNNERRKWSREIEKIELEEMVKSTTASAPKTELPQEIVTSNS